MIAAITALLMLVTPALAQLNECYTVEYFTDLGWNHDYTIPLDDAVVAQVFDDTPEEQLPGERLIVGFFDVASTCWLGIETTAFRSDVEEALSNLE